MSLWLAAPLLFLAVLVAADRITARLVADAVAKRLFEGLALFAPPAVTFRTFPFLDQPARGRYRHIQLKMQGLGEGKVRLASVDVGLHGVRLVATGGVHTEVLLGHGRLDYEELERVLPGMGLDYGGEGLVKVSAVVPVLGPVPVSAYGRPELRRRVLLIRPERFDFDPMGVAGQVIRRALLIRVPIPRIPKELKIDLFPTEQGVEFDFHGRDMTLAPRSR